MLGKLNPYWKTVGSAAVTLYMIVQAAVTTPQGAQAIADGNITKQEAMMIIAGLVSTGWVFQKRNTAVPGEPADPTQSVAQLPPPAR